jgi:hypothetical protein
MGMVGRDQEGRDGSAELDKQNYRRPLAAFSSALPLRRGEPIAREVRAVAMTTGRWIAPKSAQEKARLDESLVTEIAAEAITNVEGRMPKE